MNGDTFLPFGPNAGYLEELYQLYLTDPSVVEPEWAEFFKALDQGGGHGFKNGALNGGRNGHAHTSVGSIAAGSVGERLANAFREYGHLSARVSPVVAGGLTAFSPDELTLSFYGVDGDGGESDGQSYSFAGSSFSSLRELSEEPANE